jgi:prepilin-type N-terminal cleavage/methylation domain-containing protein
MRARRPLGGRLRTGYSLLELLVVIAILATLMSLISAAVLAAFSRSKARVEQANWVAHRALNPAQFAPPPHNPIRVLWIGNSYTYVNDLPDLVGVLVKAGGGGIGYTCDSRLVGGATLQQHWEQGVALQKIQQGQWDFVVLQEQSQMAVLDPDTYRYYATLFIQQIQKRKAIPMLYMTWARQWAPQQQGSYNRVFLRLAKEQQAEAAPGGMAWQLCWQSSPSINLYASDGSHPSPSGSYLTGCCFYSVFLGQSPVGLPAQVTYNGQPLVTQSDQDAAALQNYAWQAVQAVGRQLQPDWMVK